jgi:hypothetical protein
MMMANAISCHFEIVIRNSRAHQTEALDRKSSQHRGGGHPDRGERCTEAAAVPASRAACVPSTGRRPPEAPTRPEALLRLDNARQLEAEIMLLGFGTAPILRHRNFNKRYRTQTTNGRNVPQNRPLQVAALRGFTGTMNCQCSRQRGARTSPCSALNARPLTAADAGGNPTTGSMHTIARRFAPVSKKRDAPLPAALLRAPPKRGAPACITSVLRVPTS